MIWHSSHTFLQTWPLNWFAEHVHHGLEGVACWAGRSVLLLPVGHISCPFTRLAAFSVEDWNLCSSSCVATGISRELPDRSNHDCVWGMGFGGALRPSFPSGERTVGPGRVKRLQSSQFLLRFSHSPRINLFKLLQSCGLASRVLKNLILTIFCRSRPDLISAFALLETFILLLSRCNTALFSEPIFNPTRPSKPLPLRSLAWPGHWPLSQVFVTSGHFTFCFWLRHEDRK